ncbi:sigma factor-like helix-turn-helix DNA-binding protein [Brevibacterium iodinum]|uniref:sigma factor-like helix-turn-helix DNA-binding protein n=1 Tax=Brevibacterium iodinum TaxID=31943 RepID=UPI0030B85895
MRTGSAPLPKQATRWSRSSSPVQTRTVSALRILPDEQAEPIVMAFYQGMTHTQISENLQVPLGTIKSRIRDGMKKLREELEASR